MNNPLTIKPNDSTEVKAAKHLKHLINMYTPPTKKEIKEFKQIIKKRETKEA